MLFNLGHSYTSELVYKEKYLLMKVGFITKAEKKPIE